MERTFLVNTANIVLNSDDAVCVVGDGDALGCWDFRRRFTLTYDGRLWRGSLILPADVVEFGYRYLVTSSSFIKYLESSVSPRKHHKTDSSEIVDEFGVFDGVSNVNQGFLTLDSLIQLKLFSNPVHVSNSDGKVFRLKVVMHKKLRAGNTGDDTTVDIAVMNEEEFGFRAQNLYGRRIGHEDHVIFQTKEIIDHIEAFRLEVYLDSVSDEGEMVGVAHLLAQSWQNCSSGSITLPIVSANGQQQPIGHITVEYLVVRPMVSCNEWTLAEIYAKYWNWRRETLEIGHRGCGTSFSKIKKTLSNYRENTVGSLKVAGNNGADFVEFDVQLSKDFVPVIYHDFFVCITLNQKGQSEGKTLLQVPVKDLTLQQLQSLELYHVTEMLSDGSVAARTFLNDTDDDFRPFPTLKRLFDSVDRRVGFNVEIKWGLRSAKGVEDLPNQIDMNRYLDVILETIHENAFERRVVISCFHPDVCTMIRWKQCKYPVLFLTQGKTSRYETYLDPRTNSISSAITFARAADILVTIHAINPFNKINGIDVQTEEILEDNCSVESCLKAGLVMWCWGEDNNKKHNRDLLKRLGLHAIIYDRINEVNPGKANIFTNHVIQ